MKRNLIFVMVVFPYLQVLSQTPEQLKGWLPKIEGWKISDKIEIFDHNNLFDRINGAAPLFLENNFREMTAMEYVRGDEYITIQAYRHNSPEDAFGMYAAERSPEMTHFSIGGEAQGDDTNIYFFVDCMYIKMWANGSEEIGNIIRKVADKFADNIAPDASYPALFKAFPNDNKQKYTEAFITSNYIGHEFLENVYTVDYILDGNKVQAFIIDTRTINNAREILRKYFQFAKQSLEFSEGFHIINDRYNGDIPIMWKKEYILGIFPENEDEIKNPKEFLEKIKVN